MKLGWEQKLKSIHFNERFKNSYQENSKKFNNEVKEILEKVGNELQLTAKLGNGKFSFTEQASDNFRDLLRIGGSLLLVAGTIVGFFVPPVGIAIGIAATVVSGIAQLFKSQDEKRREAVQNISTLLNRKISSHRQTTLQQTKDDFSKYCDFVAKTIDIYFEELIQGLEAIATHLETAKKKLDGTTNYLNRAYAKRIVDWSTEKYEPLNDEGINKTIAKVKRDFWRSITIETQAEIQPKKSQEDIKQVLQEDVFIQSIR